MNDIHSHLESESYTYTMDINGVSTSVKGQLGGMARAAAKIKELQTAYGSNVLTVNAGDLIQGTFYFTAFEGDATADMFNQISWDVFELGNHEFDNGDAFLGTLLEKFNAGVDVLAANVEPAAGNVLENKWTPYVVKEIDGEKIGIIGIDIKQKTEVSSSPSPEITFLDETTTAQKYIDELTAMGVNKIILVTHQGLNSDLTMAAQLSGVDVIIGGDSHSLMGDFSAVGLSAVTNDYPKEVTDANGSKVCVAQAWQYSYMVGDLHVSFDAEGVVESCEGREVLLMGEPFTIGGSDVNATADAAIKAIVAANANLEIVAEDAAAAAVLDPYKNQVDAKKKEVIGYAAATLGHNRVPYDKKDGKSVLPFGSDIAPIVCAGFMSQDPNADVCIQNAGGVRIAVDEGNITMGTAYTLLPFKNTLFEIKMKGSEIKQVLEDALTNYIDNGGSTGSFPYAYALRYDVNASQAANNRIGNLEVMDKSTKTWSAIADDVMYTVITNNYTAEGHDGYVTFKTVQDDRGLGIDTYLDYAMSFVTYVREHTDANKSINLLPADQYPIKCYVDDAHPTCPVTMLHSDFEDSTLGDWTVVDLNGTKTWNPASYKTLKYAYMNGYKEVNDDWLVSPKITFIRSQELSFVAATNYSGPNLKVMISTDYNGSGDVEGASWTELADLNSSNDHYVWRNTQIDLSPYSGEGYIAFRYTSGAKSGEAAAWEVDDINITK